MPATYTVSYTSIGKMLLVLPDLGSATTLTSAQLFEFAGQAESEMNAALVKKYALPLSGEVPILTTLATDIAIYKVLTRRLFTPERLAASPWPDRYKEAVAQLEKIAVGDLMLVNASGAAVGDRTDLAEVYCLDPKTRILTADLRWVSLGDMRLGEEVVAFDEDTPGGHQHRKIRVARITALGRIVAPAFWIEFEDGRRLIASAEHKWLGRGRTDNTLRWRTTEELKPGIRIRDIGHPWEPDQSSGAGYLAGVYDGEGYLFSDRSFRIGFTQLPGSVLNHTRELLVENGFRISSVRAVPSQLSRAAVMTFAIAGLYDCLRFLGQIRPLRLLENATHWLPGRAPTARLPGRPLVGYGTVIRLIPVGERELVAIETSTHTLFAEGLFTHNSTTREYVPTMWEGPTPDHVIDPQKIEDEADRRGLTVRDRLI